MAKPAPDPVADLEQEAANLEQRLRAAEAVAANHGRELDAARARAEAAEKEIARLQGEVREASAVADQMRQQRNHIIERMKVILGLFNKGLETIMKSLEPDKNGGQKK